MLTNNRGLTDISTKVNKGACTGPDLNKRTIKNFVETRQFEHGLIFKIIILLSMVIVLWLYCPKALIC